MRLNEDQRKIAAILAEPAAKIAARLKVDSGVAYIALCEAILRHDPTKGSVEVFALNAAYWTCRREGAKERLVCARNRRDGSVDRLALSDPELPLSAFLLPGEIEVILEKFQNRPSENGPSIGNDVRPRFSASKTKRVLRDVKQRLTTCD
jgi:hypothetical protein